MKYKSSFILLGAVLISTTLQAFAQSEPLIDPIAGAYCQMFGGLAETIMEQRQINTPISVMLQRTREFYANFGHENLPVDENWVTRIVILAYEQPPFHDPEIQQVLIADFRNEVELSCYSALLD